MDDIWPWLTAGGLRGHAGGSWLGPGALGHSNPPTGFPGPVTDLPRMSRQFVAYYRVSTDRQGRSGLGLDAQREAVFRHLASQAGDLIGEFCEVESGRRSDRPRLAA